jgi:hypothetical protein
MKSYLSLLLVLFFAFPEYVAAQSQTPAKKPVTSPRNYTTVPFSEHSKKQFILQNTYRPSKKVKIINSTLTFLVDEARRSPDAMSRLNTVECTLDSLKGDSIVVRLITEEIEIERNNFFTALSNSYYEGDGNEVYRGFALKDILYISTKSRFRTFMSKAGSVIMAASILTMISAPFAGTRLNGESRAQARSEVFLTGVSGFIVAIPFFVIGKNRKYGMSLSYPTRHGNYWILQQNSLH